MAAGLALVAPPHVVCHAQTLLVTNMHKRLERAASRGKLVDAAPVPRAADTPDRSSAGAASMLSPNPVSPRTLKVLEGCTLSSSALHNAATATIQHVADARLSLSPMRARDGRTSLSPLAMDKAQDIHVPAGSATAPTIVAVSVGAENQPPQVRVATCGGTCVCSARPAYGRGVWCSMVSPASAARAARNCGVDRVSALLTS